MSSCMSSTWSMLICLNCFFRSLFAAFIACTVPAVSFSPSCANMICSMLNCWFIVFSFWPSYIFFCLRIASARFCTCCFAGPGFIFFICSVYRASSLSSFMIFWSSDLRFSIDADASLSVGFATGALDCPKRRFMVRGCEERGCAIRARDGLGAAARRARPRATRSRSRGAQITAAAAHALRRAQTAHSGRDRRDEEAPAYRRARRRRPRGRRRLLVGAALPRAAAAAAPERARRRRRDGAVAAAEASATSPGTRQRRRRLGRRQHVGPAPRARAGHRGELRVPLLMLVIDASCRVPFLVASYARSFPTYELAVHTGPAPADAGASHVSYEATVAALAARFASKLGAPPEVVRRKFASAKGLSDLKPFYGKVFEELLQGGCTHWGWVDWDVLAGDLRSAIPQAQLWEYDAVTLPGATLGFAWAGQLSVFQNKAELRELYRVVGDHVALGFKCCATEGNKEAGQSGWEERVFLRDVLRTKPRLRVAFNMAAQYDYKAQWLTWVPFDHYWRDGKVWRCAQRPLARPGRPPLLPDAPRLRREVAAIQRDPQAFYKSKDRACIRWDLTSSPWMCCPHSTGVTYTWDGAALAGAPTPHRNASADELAALNALRRSLASGGRGARPRVDGEYDLCLEGAFFHAGLTPIGGDAPACAAPERGGWALLDDIGRFSGKLAHLGGETCPPPEAEKSAAGKRRRHREGRPASAFPELPLEAREPPKTVPMAKPGP